MRASEFGGCMRAIVAKELGYTGLEPPPRMASVFQAGHDAEDRAIQLLTNKGWVIQDRQREVTFEGITGHIDGTYHGKILEIKSFSPTEHAKFKELGIQMGGLMERYKWQVSIYMEAMSRPCVIVGFNRETEEMPAVELSLPPHSPEAIVARVEEIQRWVELGELPPCTPQYPCPFVYLHDPDPRDDDPLVEELGEQYEALMGQKKELEAATAKVRSALEDAMGERDVVDCPNIKVTRYWAANPARVDVARIKEDGLWEKYAVDSGKSRRLRITLRENS